MAISNREFAVGDQVVVTYGERRVVAKAVKGDEKRPVIWHVTTPKDFAVPEALKAGKGESYKGGKDGRTFISLGIIEDAITHPKVGPNRYQFFTRLEDEAAEAKAKAEKTAAATAKKADKATKVSTGKVAKEAKKAEKAAKKETKVAKKNRRNGGYNLIKKIDTDAGAPNDYTFWCDACAESFEAEGGPFDTNGLPLDCPNGHVAGGVQNFVREESDAEAGSPVSAEIEVEADGSDDGDDGVTLDVDESEVGELTEVSGD